MACLDTWRKHRYGLILSLALTFESISAAAKIQHIFLGDGYQLDTTEISMPRDHMKWLKRSDPPQSIDPSVPININVIRREIRLDRKHSRLKQVTREHNPLFGQPNQLITTCMRLTNLDEFDNATTEVNLG